MYRYQYPSKALVNSTQGSRVVILKRLEKQHQQQIWRGMQKTKPGLADLLQHDQNIQAIKDMFDGTLVLEKPEAADYYRAGK